MVLPPHRVTDRGRGRHPFRARRCRRAHLTALRTSERRPWSHRVSYRLVDRVLLESTARGNDKLVLAMIAAHAKDDGAGAHPSTRRLAALSGLSRSTVQACIGRLVTAGLLIYRERGGRHANDYLVVFHSGPVVGPQGSDDRATTGPVTGQQRTDNKAAGVSPQGSSGPVVGHESVLESVSESSSNPAVAPPSPMGRAPAEEVPPAAVSIDAARHKLGKPPRSAA